MNIMELINNFKDPVLIEQLTFGEKISASLFVTLLGMTITFVALIVLWGLTAMYSKMVQNAEAKKKAGAVVEVKQPVAAPTPAPVAAEPEEDEEELIAVISAAIAAQMGTSMHNIVVRNIVRVADNTPAWGQSGRFEQMNSRM